MTGPTHITFAAASSLAIVQQVGTNFHWTYLVAILIGSLAPDVDSQRTSLHSPSRILDYFLPKVLTRSLDWCTRRLAATFRLFVSHRGILHTPLIGLSLFCLAIALQSQLLFWFSFAYLGHLLLDYCTAGGIPFLIPFSKRSYSAFPIRTGSFLETVFCSALLWYIVVAMYQILKLDSANLPRLFALI